MSTQIPSLATAPPRNWKHAEETFLTLARSCEIGPYLGRLTDATDGELRAIFGLAVAALRRSEKDADKPTEWAAPAAPSTAVAPLASLETCLEQMTVALAQRDQTIRELKQALGSDKGLLREPGRPAKRKA